MTLNRETERLITRVAAQALREYDLTGAAFQQEVEMLAQELSETAIAHLQSLGLARRA